MNSQVGAGRGDLLPGGGGVTCTCLPPFIDTDCLEHRDDRRWPFRVVSAGMYDDTLECAWCGFRCTESADAPNDENARRQAHDCNPRDLDP